MTWKKDGKEEKTEKDSVKAQLKDKKVKCRICDGEHFTARCPFKDTMAPMGEDTGPGAGGDAGGEDEAAPKEGGLGGGGGGYVPPHLRKGAGASSGERMGGKYERDDLATLRVTNVSTSQKTNKMKEFQLIPTASYYPGLRICRRKRPSRNIRALRPRHKSFPRQRPRNESSQGVRIY